MDSAPSRTISDVLIPTDGSDCAGTAVDHGLELAAQYGARVHALYVVDLGAFPVGFEGTPLDPGPLIDALETVGDRATGDVAERARDYGVEVERVVRQGWVHDTILDYVSEAGIDLVAMGTHGRRGVRRYLLGSVTERVVRLSEVPVLVVPPSDGGGRPDYGNVLLPVDDRETAGVAGELAFDVAGRYDATVHVLHVVDVTNAETAPDADRRREEGQRLVDGVGSEGEDLGLRVRTEVRTSEPFEAICAYADEEDVDLIVMATHGRTGVNRALLGSVTERVLRTTTVPVLTCRATPDG